MNKKLIFLTTFLTFNISANNNLVDHNEEKENICYQEHKQHHELQNCNCKIREAKSCKVESAMKELIEKFNKKNKK